MLRKIIRLLVWVIVAFFIYKAAIWAYGTYQAKNRAPSQQQVLDIDKNCEVIADTGQCKCRHRKTNERLSVPYSKCVSLASDS
jgi:hypothetical protein